MSFSERQDDVRCVILERVKPGAAWNLLYITLKKSVGWRSAHAIQQDGIKVHPKYKCILAVEEDYYEKGRIRELKPPKDFNFGNHIESVDEPDKNFGVQLAKEDSVGFNTSEDVPLAEDATPAGREDQEASDDLDLD